jgi:hypothetical protein
MAMLNYQRVKHQNFSYGAFKPLQNAGIAGKFEMFILKEK